MLFTAAEVDAQKQPDSAVYLNIVNSYSRAREQGYARLFTILHLEFQEWHVDLNQITQESLPTIRAMLTIKKAPK